MATRRRRPGPRRRKASTTDVIGQAARRERVPLWWREHFKRLNELRNLVLSRQNGQVRDATEEQPSFSLHMADAGTDSFDRDLALSRISAEQDALYEIDEAINRIRDGTYGICELTGKRIEAKRLAAIPWTRFSLKAEEQLEKEGAVRPARLAPREPVTREGSETSAAERSAESESSERE